MTFDGLADFCRRVCAIDAADDGQPTRRYVRVRQREGRARVVVAGNIECTDERTLHARLVEILRGLETGRAWVECLPRGESTPCDSLVVMVRGRDEEEEDEARTIAEGVAGILAEARRMMKDANDRAGEATAAAIDAIHTAHTAREEALLAIFRAQREAETDGEMGAALQSIVDQLGPAVPLIAARLLGGPVAAPKQSDGAGEPTAGRDQLRACALEAVAVLEQVFERCPELAKDEEVIHRMTPLVRAALGF